MYPWVIIAPAVESPLPKPTTLFYPAGRGQDCGDAGTIGAMSAEICGLFEIDTLTTFVILSLSCEESNLFLEPNPLLARWMKCLIQTRNPAYGKDHHLKI